MPIELQTGILAAVVALITASLTGYLTWRQIRQERAKWLFDIKTTLSVELFRERMAEYAKLSRILGGLSTTSQANLTPARAHKIAATINEWMYGAGGLLASARTRTAGWALRDRLLRWKAGRQPKDILEVRKLLMWSMRWDLDIPSGRKDDASGETLMTRLQEEMEEVG